RALLDPLATQRAYGCSVDHQFHALNHDEWCLIGGTSPEPLTRSDAQSCCFEQSRATGNKLIDNAFGLRPPCEGAAGASTAARRTVVDRAHIEALHSRRSQIADRAAPHTGCRW